MRHACRRRDAMLGPERALHRFAGGQLRAHRSRHMVRLRAPALGRSGVLGPLSGIAIVGAVGAAAASLGRNRSAVTPVVDECVFCRIVAGAEPCHAVYEDEQCLGFLDIFPNTEAFSVVITKEHIPSDIARADGQVAAGLLTAARRVAARIADAYDDVDRCAIVFEGMMIDHLHAKVIPLHRTAGVQPSPAPATTARSQQYFEAYPGYVTTEISAGRASDEHLAAVAARINSQGRR